MPHIILPVLALLAATSSIAQDEDAADAMVQFVCPVGGEKFSQNTLVPYYPLESYPDGGGPGVELSDLELPECPSNGLVLMIAYSHGEGDSQEPYSPSEVARLPGLIADPAYQALRKDTRAARLLWLAEQLGRPAGQRFHLIQRAAWVARTPAERRHWMERIANEGEALAASPGFPPQFAIEMRYFVINALRELGRFDEAGAKLTQYRADAEREQSNLQSKKPPNPNVENFYQSEDHGNVDAMQQAIDERDDDRFPVSMMGSRWANSVCNKLDDSPVPVTPATRRGCAARKAAKDRDDEYQALYSKLSKDAALQTSVCLRRPSSKRSELENRVCRDLASQSAWEVELAQRHRVANALLAKPAALDQRCKAVTIGRNDTPANALAEACQRRASDLATRETARLIALMERKPSEYDRLCHWDYPETMSEDPVEAACASIKSDRDDKLRDQAVPKIAKLTTAELDAKCPVRDKTGAAVRDKPDAYADALNSACYDWEYKRNQASWDALKADPAKLAATCARPLEEIGEYFTQQCGFLEDDRVDDLAWQLAKDHTALVAQCQATPHAARDAVLTRACDGYRKCVIVPVGTRVPQANMIPGDVVIAENDEDYRANYLKGSHGDGTAAFCYETPDEASAAWELVKDPAKRVIDPPPFDQPQPKRATAKRAKKAKLPPVEAAARAMR